MWKGLEWSGKGPGYLPLMLTWFIVVELDLKVNVKDFKLELKVLVDCLLCNLIVWLPYTEINNAEISIGATWSPSLLCSGNGRTKNPSEVSGFLEYCNLF